MRERGNPILHFLDRYAGIPTIAILGYLKAKRQIPSTIKSIGLLKTGAIGDTVLMTGVIADLRSAFPNASIIFFAGKSNLEIANMVDHVDHVVHVPTHDLSKGLKAIRSVAVDVLFDFGQWSRLEALFSMFSRAAFTAGFRTPGQYRHYAYDIFVNHSSEVHELENVRRLVRCLGVETRHAPFLRAPQSSPLLRQYVVLHLWPGGRRRKQKEWPAERWLRLMEAFALLRINMVITGAPSDHDRNEELIGHTTELARPFLANAAGCSLEQTAVLLARASLVVSVDTGLMHMAAALRAPLVALHGPTSSKRWGPTNPDAVVVETALSGCGYINLGWESPPHAPACMEDIEFNVVYDACRSLLERQGPIREEIHADRSATVQGQEL
jgi:ADP-heptose:LPS heptosyltransferase